ncbi:MAG TPA: site-2 protease family protein, partial [Candidatus Levybacteria bacterium]|nr:site-2 protease family protein [Candidatus Levybacteria bacterium]
MEFLIVIGAIIFSVILHEVMHGWVAEKLGDPTARLMGRITLNPIPHIDPFMTLLLPISMYLLSGGSFLFAAAKPVPVNPMYFKDGKKDMALVAL